MEGSQMPLRVGFDLDGTVADMYSALRQEAIKLFGEDVIRKAATNSRQPQEAGAEQSRSGAAIADAGHEDDSAPTLAMQELHLTARQQSMLWDHVKTVDNFWTQLPELEAGIIARIARNTIERRWEVIFLTTRPATAAPRIT